MSSSHPQILLGTGDFGGPKIPTAADVEKWTGLFRAYGHTRIDTAAAYPVPPGVPGDAESILAKAGATASFTIDTKVLSMGAPKLHTHEMVLKCMEKSVTALGFDLDGKGKDKVEIMYLHAPCLDTPLEETLGAVNKGYQKGWFRRLGISNYTPWHVEEICEIAEKKGWVKPSVYQGQYNPIARVGEKDLFPVLRKHGIAFFAYSPSGGGIFSGKSSAEHSSRKDGRFNSSNTIGQIYSSLYLRPEILDAANKVHKIAMEHGFTGHEASLRWCLHHSVLKKGLGDGVVVGASKFEQLEANLNACDAGPLPEDVVKAFEEVWPFVEPVAPFAYIDAMPGALNGKEGEEKGSA